MRTALRRFIWLVVLCGIGVLAYLLATARPVQVEAAGVVRGAIEDYVTEEAVTRLHTTRVVTALTFGVASRVQLEEGDRVEAGQVITTIRDTQMQAMLKRSQAQIEEMKGYLEGLDASLPEESEIAAAAARAQAAAMAVEVAAQARQVARSNLELARKEFERAERLEQTGVLSEGDLDRARRDYEVARQEAASAETRHAIAEVEEKIARLQKQVLLESLDDTEHLKKVYGARIEQIDTEMELISEELAKTTVRSPIDGVVLAKFWDQEGYVSQGTELLVVGDMDSIEIETDILSDEVRKVRVGQLVRLEGRALGDEPAVGRVKRIYPAGFTKVSALGVPQQRVKVLIEFDNSRLGLGPGYELDVKIVTDAKQDVVLVPAAAVFATAEGMAAFKIVDGRAALVPLKIGTRGEEHWEVVEGLEPGDTVIVHPPGDLEDGDRVKAD